MKLGESVISGFLLASLPVTKNAQSLVEWRG